MVSSSSSHYTCWLPSSPTRPGGQAPGSSSTTIYENWLFQIFIIFCALFHVINGLRIVILDLWPKLIEYQREAIWIEWFVFLPIYSIALFVIIRVGLGG